MYHKFSLWDVTTTPSGLYARLCHAFLVFLYFLTVFRDQLSQNVLKICKIGNSVGGNDRSYIRFLNHLRDVDMATNFCAKSAKLAYLTFTCRTSTPKLIGISQRRWAQ